MDRRPGRRSLRSLCGHRYEPNLRGHRPGRPVYPLYVVFIGVCVVLPTYVLSLVTENYDRTNLPTITPYEKSFSQEFSTPYIIPKDTDDTEASSFLKRVQIENTHEGANALHIEKIEHKTSPTGTTPITSDTKSLPAVTSHLMTASTSVQLVTVPLSTSTQHERTTANPSNTGIRSLESTTPLLKTTISKTAYSKRALLKHSKQRLVIAEEKLASRSVHNESKSGKERLEDYDTDSKAVQSGAELNSNSKLLKDKNFEVVQKSASMTPAIYTLTTESKFRNLTQTQAAPSMSSIQDTPTQSYLARSKGKVLKSTTAWDENLSKFHVDDHVTSDDADGTASTNVSSMGWPTKMAAVVEGDLVLGGLMMVHEREDTITCGPIMPQGGVQALEAMLYTLDVINAKNMLPGFTLGAHILDDCDKDTYGLEMAVDFIKGMASAFVYFTHGTFHCTLILVMNDRYKIFSLLNDYINV